MSMKRYSSMTPAERAEERAAVTKIYDEYKNKGLKLDMSRGKPCTEQLSLSEGMNGCVNADTGYKAADGMDVRNYGGLDGIPEAKALFADMLSVSVDEVIVGGNSSLNLMHDSVARSFLKGVLGNTPWSKLDTITFLCPSPGYDRHFAILEHFGVRMEIVPMNEDGPDMDIVEQRVKDGTVKGMFCVPKYSNPDGIVYSDKTVKRLAQMETAAPDFRIYWDNAYAVHDLTDNPPALLNILDECKKAGNDDRVYIFASTSKISYAGGGISVIASSKNNVADIKKQMAVQTIGFDKINQLAHVRFFKDMDGIRAHMKKHADIIAPKFKAVLKLLDEELSPRGLAEYTRPVGGYFISVNLPENCAKRTVELCRQAGVVLTGAGATFPYGKDPHDRNLRIAPTFPSVEELVTAMELFCVCVRLAALEQE